MATILAPGLAFVLSLFLAHLPGSFVAADTRGACPEFSDGKWAVGELKAHVNTLKQNSRMNSAVNERSPRACCDVCTRTPTCKYWTWKGNSRLASLGNCTLFREFACEADSAGSLPIDTSNKNARTGSNVCSRPETRDTTGTIPPEVKREAAIAEVKSHLNAEIALNEAEIAKLKAEEQAILRLEAEAEAEAAEEEKVLAEAKLAEAVAKAELAKAKAQEARAAATLKAAEEAEAAARAKVAEEAAEEARILDAEQKLEAQLRAAKLAKASADEILAMQMVINDKERQSQVLANPFTSCPAKVEKGQWAVGTLRNMVGSDGSYSRLGDSLEGVSPAECCKSCGLEKECGYWSWVGRQKGAVKGDCSFFKSTGCSADSFGALPFEQTNKLGRVGKACGISSSS